MPLPRSSGTYSYSQLEQLWISAGGNAGLAPVMAAIAMAESGGNPNARNPSGATGLWQILGAVHPSDQGRLLDPHVNAREAVAKFHTQGLKAWTTYTSGAYRTFLQKGVHSAVETGGRAFADEAAKFLGKPYVWGGESPKVGFDCSGLVQYVSQQLGIKNMPRTSEEQWAHVKHITRAELQPGDLVFSQWPGDNASPGHVQIYAGNDQVIGADSTNVEKVSMKTDIGHVVGYGRIPGVSQGSVGVGGVPATSPGKSGGFFSDIANMFGLGQATSTFSDISHTLSDVEQAITWFFVPSHWVRIFAGAGGGILVLSGVLVMTRTGRSYSVNVPGVGGVPTVAGGETAPAIGIALVTLGAVLLFVAFHNLPEGVDTFGGFVSHLQGELQNQGKQAG